MELKQYLTLVKQWAWLLILGVVLGTLGGFVFSRYQPSIYQASTKVLIMQSPENQVQNLFAQNDQQLGQTFIELLVTRPVLQAVTERLGYSVSSGQVNVGSVRDAQLIKVTVEDSDPQHAADIANTLVTVFIEQNEKLQASRFSSSEDSLLAQRQQVEEQIANLQKQLTEVSTTGLDEQIQIVTKNIADLQQEIDTLQSEIVRLEYSGDPVEIIDVNGKRTFALPTPNVDQRVDLTLKKNRLTELQSLVGMYQTVYVNLAFSKNTNTSGNTRNTDQIQAALVLYQQIYSNLLNNYESVRLARLQETPNIVQVEEALPPRSPIRPNHVTNMILGCVIGLLISGSIAFLVEYLDDTFRTPDDAANLLDLPVLANIADVPRSFSRGKKEDLPFMFEQPRSPVAEAFRTLRTNLEFVELDKPLKTLLITSSGVGEGKTTVAVNLAIALAQAGKRVILLDADLRRPRVHDVLDLPNRSGLSDMLRDHINSTSVAQAFKNEHLSVITSGSLPPNPAEVLSSEKMVSILNDLKNKADFVIVDGPPSLLADASVLSAKVDGVLVVVQAKRTHAGDAVSMLDQLDRAGARVVGLAFNRIQRKDTHYYYGKLKHYSYYSYDDVESDLPLQKDAL